MYKKLFSYDKLLINTISTIARFPSIVLFAVIATALSIYEIENSNTYLQDILFASILAIFVFTSSTLLTENFKNKTITYIAHAVCAILIFLYYMILPPDFGDTPDYIIFREIFLVLMFFLSIFFIPFIGKDISNSLVWKYMFHILWSLVFTVVVSLILYLGIIGAIASVVELFELDIDNNIYMHIWLIVTGIFAVLFFLWQIPKEPLILEGNEANKYIIILTKYILSPLVFVYFVILYLYTAQMIWTFDMPKGIISWMIIAFSSIAIFTYLSWTPYYVDTHNRYKKALWIAIFLQTFVLGLAIGVRIYDYSVSVDRYMVAILGAWLFFISLYFIVSKDPKYKYVFMSLCGIIFVSQIGYIGSYDVSLKLQSQKLKHLIDDNNLSQNTDLKIRYEVSDVINYIVNNYGLDGIEPVMSNIVKDFKNDKNMKIESIYNFPKYATKKLGFDYVSHWQYKNQNKKYSYTSKWFDSPAHNIDISGYDKLQIITLKTRHDDKRGLYFEFDKNQISITDKSGAKFTTIDMKEFFQRLYTKDKKNIDEKDLTYIYENDKIKAKIHIQNVRIDADVIGFIRLYLLYILKKGK